MQAIHSIFGKQDKIVIGVVHFPPTLDLPDAQPLSLALDHALADLAAFEEGGVEGIIIENNYDLPHRIQVGPGTVAEMTALGLQLRAATRLPMGVCVLWNDVEASFAVAKAIGAQFIRIPVFVDDVKTDFGRITGNPETVRRIRQAHQAESIAIVADIHVKHSTILSQTTIAESAVLAMQQGADALIVTGSWTGQSPAETDLSAVRKAIPSGPIFAGSGVNDQNIGGILRTANGVIVSTSLKKGMASEAERNVKPWQARIDAAAVEKLVAASRLML